HRRVALVIAADEIASVSAGIQQHLDPVLLVARDDHRLLAHAGKHEIPRPGDLALVSHEEPGTVEDPLHLLVIDVLVAEDLTAHGSAVEVDQFPHRAFCGNHATLPIEVLGPARAMNYDRLAA